MGKVFEVSYYGIEGIELMEESCLHFLGGDPSVNQVKKVEQCQSCGESTAELQVAGCLARCQSCSKEYENVQERACSYMSETKGELYYSHDIDE